MRLICGPMQGMQTVRNSNGPCSPAYRLHRYIWPFVLMYMMPSGEGAGGAAPAGGGAKKK